MLLTIHDQPSYCYTGGKAFDAALPTAVFIHGAQNDHSVWVLQTRYFAHHGFGVLAVDLPGHGRSGGAPLQSIEAMADWLLALLDAAGVQLALLIGHSMGSLVALETACRAPARASGLALVATAYPMKVSEALLEASRHQEQAAIDMVNIWSHSAITPTPSMAGPGSLAIGIGKRLMQRIAARNPAPVFYTDFSACNGYANGAAAAASVACPTLFLLGEKDAMTSARATAPLISAMPNARVVRLENCGHALMAEQPDAVLTTLFGFAGSATSQA
jgi:pimeloyl-ACP methyl ester carboxylesterase